MHPHGLPHDPAKCVECAEIQTYLDERQARLDQLEAQIEREILRAAVFTITRTAREHEIPEGELRAMDGNR